MSDVPISPNEAVAPGNTASPGAEIDKEVARTPRDQIFDEESSREERIGRAPYRRYEERGGADGDADSDWRAAEEEIDRR